MESRKQKSNRQIAQRFSAGFRSRQMSKSRRDGRGFLSSRRDPVVFVHHHPAMNGWAIFRGDSTIMPRGRRGGIFRFLQAVVNLSFPFRPGSWGHSPHPIPVLADGHHVLCRPSRDFFIWLTFDPAINGWAIVIAQLRDGQTPISGIAREAIVAGLTNLNFDRKPPRWAASARVKCHFIAKSQQIRIISSKMISRTDRFDAGTYRLDMGTYRLPRRTYRLDSKTSRLPHRTYRLDAGTYRLHVML